MATVFKSTTGTWPSSATTFHLEDVSQQATRCLEEAQSRAEAVIAQAMRQAEEIRLKAAEEGRQAAILSAEQALDEKIGRQMQTLLPALASAVAQLSGARQAWLRQWERSSIQLVARVAHRVIRRQIEWDPQIKLDLLREALELAAGSPRIKIMLSPLDFESLGGRAAMLVREIAAAAEPKIVLDESISAGGCRVETDHGAIDQQIETRLERIVNELTDD